MADSNINFIVVGISQNNYYTLLKKFINHLERREDGNGWVIISKPNHEINNFRNEIENHRPQHARKRSFYIWMEWYEMGENELDFKIERFLQKYFE